MSQKFKSVPVEADALYICTMPLLAGSFHWSFLHVDPTGACTRHHWAAVTLDVRGREAYVEQALPNGLSSAPTAQILGCFKIADLAPPEIGDFRAACRAIFTKSFPTADENRKHAITCRTWMMKIVATLLSPERAEQIEKDVIARSRAFEGDYLSAFMAGRRYECVVQDV
ncbi:hypothetical protein OF83DRAFT_1168355 [Amylostereum chailletii]|nr:hypothetical protein OF83DRAFT_1168355 [Amylostereum chailletii]